MTWNSKPERRLRWIDEYADLQGNGYIAYQRRNEETGLENQCWKDSWDSISYRDGTLPGFPRATCELQGYAYDAKVRGARLARHVWHDSAFADRLEKEAADLKRRFNRDFWVADGEYFAVALDADGRQVDSLTSNNGHLLWSGIVDKSKARRVADHLMGERLFSGWGVRTLAEGEGRFNPIGYHVGTIWPFDNSFIAWGLRRYGFKDQAARIAEGILDAARFFDGRLPEAFGGYPRWMTRYPVQYPTACTPQAWSTAAPLLLLRTMLGLEPLDNHLDRRSGHSRQSGSTGVARHTGALGPHRRLRPRSGGVLSGQATENRLAMTVASDVPPSAGDSGTDGRHRVVIVGGGFGGLPATRLLGGKPVDVTLIDRRNHHLFQPLLYQTATGMLAPGQIAPALRHIVRREKNVRVLLADVSGFDLDRRVVHATVGGQVAVEYPYDSLIVAAGVTQSYFGHDEFAFFAPGMKTLDDAFELRRRIFGAFEVAELVTDPIQKERWLTVVVVGAGPTGVELAGQVRELATRSLRGEFRTFEASSVRVILVDGGKEPLATFGDRLSAKTAKTLEHLGIELRMGGQVVGSTARVSTSRGPTATPGSRPAPPSGPPASRLPRWRACWPGPRVPLSTEPAGSPSCPTSPCPAIPKCLPWATWPAWTSCPGWPKWPCRVAFTPPTPSFVA